MGSGGLVASHLDADCGLREVLGDDGDDLFLKLAGAAECEGVGDVVDHDGEGAAAAVGRGDVAGEATYATDVAGFGLHAHAMEVDIAKACSECAFAAGLSEAVEED